MKVQLALAANGLPTEASYQATVVWTTSASDDETNTSTVLGRTEASAVTASPAWSKLINTPDTVAPDAQLTVHIRPASAASDDDPAVATAHFALNAITSSYYQAAASFTTQEADNGAKIALHVTKEPRMGKFTLQLAGADLPETDFGLLTFGKKQHTDPFFELYSGVTGKKLVRSAVVEDNLSPTWPAIEMDLDVLCGGRLDAPIRITIHDKDKGDQTQYLGQVLVSVNQLMGSASGSTSLKHFPVLKGGTATAQGSIYAKQAELTEADVASRQAQQHLQLVLQALDAQRDQLLEQVTTQETAATEALAAAEAIQATVQAIQEKADALADAQAGLRTKLDAVQKEHKKLLEAAKVSPCTGTLVLQLAAQNLPDADFGIRNKSDPFYEIMSASSNNRKKQVMRSEKIDNNLNPVWKEHKLDLATLGGGLDQPFSIVVNDKDDGDKQTLLGSTETTVNALVQAATSGASMKLVPSDDGVLVVKKAQLQNDLINHQAAAEQFQKDHVQPVVAECTQAAHDFEAIYKELETARAEAAAGLEAANAAKDAAESVKLTLELMEKAAA